MSRPSLDERDDLYFSLPDIDKIVCKDCMHREEDRVDGAIKGAILGVCNMYYDKPYEILWQGGDCPYYRNEYNPHRDDDDDE